MSAPAPRRMPWQLSIILTVLSVECMVLIGVTREPLVQLPAGWVVHAAMSLCFVGFAATIFALVLQTWQRDLQRDRLVNPVTRCFAFVYAGLLCLPALLWAQPMPGLERFGLILMMVSAGCLFSLAIDGRFWRQRR